MNWIFCWGEKRARNFIETTTATKFCRWKFLVHTFIAIGCYTNALETHPYNDIVPCTDIHWEDWYQYVKCNFVSMCWASILYVKIVVAPNCPCIGSIGRISNEKWISTDKTNEWFLLEKNISACFSFRLKKPANGISSSYDCRVYAGYGIFFYMQLIQWLWLNRRNILETSFISAQWYHCNWIAQHVKLLSKPFDKAENYMDDGKMFIKHVIAHLLAFSMNGQCDITSIFDHFRLLETHSCFHSAQGAWEGFHFLIYFYNVF